MWAAWVVQATTVTCGFHLLCVDSRRSGYRVEHRLSRPVAHRRLCLPLRPRPQALAQSHQRLSSAACQPTDCLVSSPDKACDTLPVRRGRTEPQWRKLIVRATLPFSWSARRKATGGCTPWLFLCLLRTGRLGDVRNRGVRVPVFGEQAT